MSRIIKPPPWAANQAEAVPGWRGYWRGLVGATPFLGGNPVELIQGGARTNIDTLPTSGPSALGLVRKYGGDGDEQWAHTGFDGFQPSTWLAVVRPNALSVLDRFLTMGPVSGITIYGSLSMCTPADGDVRISIRGSGATFAINYSSTGQDFYAVDTWTTILASVDPTNAAAGAQFVLSSLGGFETFSRSAAPSGTMLPVTYDVGTWALGPNGYRFNGDIALTALWQRQFTLGEARRIIRNPFGMFTRGRRISVVVPAPVVDEEEEGPLEESWVEGAVAGDTFEASGTFGDTLTEGAVAGDTVAAILSMADDISEGVLAGETLEATLLYLGAITEGATAGEVLEYTWTAVGAIAEGAVAGDQMASAATFLSAITEGAAAGDTLAAQLLLALAWTEGAVAGDAFEGTLDVLQEAVTEGIVAGETYASIVQHVKAFTEGALAGDAVAAIMQMEEAITEGIEAGDEFAAQFPGITGEITEGVTAGDVLAAQLATSAAFSAGAEAGDVYAYIHQALGTLSEGALAGEVFLSTLGALSSITEGVDAGDLFAAGLAYTAAWSEGALAGDSWSAVVITYLSGLKIIVIIMPLEGTDYLDLLLAETASIDLPLTE